MLTSYIYEVTVHAIAVSLDTFHTYTYLGPVFSSPRTATCWWWRVYIQRTGRGEN